MTTPPEQPPDPWAEAPRMTPEQNAPWGTPPGAPPPGAPPGPPPPGAPPGPPPPGYPPGPPGAPPGAPPGWGAQPGYPQPGYPGYGRPAQNGMGIAALVLGIVGLLLAFFIVGALPGLIGLVLGFVARGKVKRGEANNGGMALAGIITGAIAVAISALVLVFVAAFGDKVSDLGRCLDRAVTTEQEQACQNRFQRDFGGP